MKTCPVCGGSNPDNAAFCNACGGRLDAAPDPGTEANRESYDSYGPSYDNGPAYGGHPYGGQSYGPPILPRSILLAIILTIITCGIYGIYWMCKVNDEVNALSGEYNATSGGAVVLFSIITCGIYGVYWAYKMGQRCAGLGGEASGGILYLILALFGFQIINLALFQDVINRCV